MSNEHQVSVEISSPSSFERSQLLLRIGLGLLLAVLGFTTGVVAFTIIVLLPLIAALAIWSYGRDGYANEVGPVLWRALVWLLGSWAYMALLVDRFPGGEHDRVQIHIRFTGRPTIGSALWRLVTAIPSILALLMLMCLSSLAWFAGAVVILLGATMPDPILAFQRGVLRWLARLAAYQASLVDEYPPFSFETGDGHDAPAAVGGRSS